MTSNISKDIFKAYDIRGIVNETLTKDAIIGIAKAYATKAVKRQVTDVVVGRDGRLSGKEIVDLLIETLIRCGLNVIDIGQVATPMLYFAAHQWTNGSGIMITGSHNPSEYNGFKMMLAGETLFGDTIKSLFEIICSGQYFITKNQGKLKQQDISKLYQDAISQDVQLKRPMKVIVDAGNGIAGQYVGALYRAIGCDLIELFCDVDGTFPNHHPDPAKPENLQDIKLKLQNSDAQIGLAFDGDGDRLGVVTKDGNIIYPDRLLMLFSEDILSRNKNASIIYDVKCTRLLAPWIISRGGNPIISKTGHSYIKASMKHHNALLAGEMSGHIFFQERWFGFDDGLYAGARLLEVLSCYENPSAFLNSLPNAISTPEINIPMQKEGQNHELIRQIQLQAKFKNTKKIIDIDGLRVEYADGFGLIRASNTTPVLVLRFEADNEVAVERIQNEFRMVLQAFSNLTF
ncbi:MAG: phosphomannomutase/phosphoglucomutase [Neisseriaceae bacterium]|nr:MAG: phosphomannomutase/phosphoglucomutase [Neisseriaceae bacterium]